MKKPVMEFLKRGLTAASGGPLILAVVYGILGYTGTVDTVHISQVSGEIVTILILAFLAGGITTVYQCERLPLGIAILLHAAVLYIIYIVIYLLNGWLPAKADAVGIFTVIFVTGYTIVWILIYAATKKKTVQLNQYLHKQE